MSTSRKRHLFVPFIRDIDMDCAWEQTQQRSNDIHMEKYTLGHTDALISSSESCIWKLLHEKWLLPALNGNIFQPVEGFFWELAHIQDHSGFTAVLQRLNAAYGTQVPLFHH